MFGIEIVTYEWKEIVEGSREAFQAELTTQLKSELEGVVNSFIEYALFGPTGTAHAANQPAAAKSNAQTAPGSSITLEIFSRPVDLPTDLWYDHMFISEQDGKTIELLNESGTSKVYRNNFRTMINSNRFSGSTKGPLTVTLSRAQFEAAFRSVKQRYNSIKYELADSNRFVIDLFQEAGRPLTKEELAGIGITSTIFGPAVIITKNYAYDFLYEKIIHNPKRDKSES